MNTADPMQAIASDAVPAETSRQPPGPLTDWELYHGLVEIQLRPGLRVLEIGCGRGDIAPFPWERYGSVRLTGVDLDPGARENRQIQEFMLLRAGRPWPLPDSFFDLALARYVLEHVCDAQHFLDNVWRVLRPGGSFLFLTPNSRHPAALTSRLLPVRWKRTLLERTRSVPGHQVYPTHYGMNTAGQLKALAEQSFFAVETLLTRELVPCAYLDFCRPTRLVARAFLEFITRTGLEHRCGAHIIGSFRKRPSA
jgi:SAM-dependent methyltransferase